VFLFGPSHIGILLLVPCPQQESPHQESRHQEIHQKEEMTATRWLSPRQVSAVDRRKNKEILHPKDSNQDIHQSQLERI